MRINSSIVQAYVSGEDMSKYQKEWFFSSSVLDVDIGKNIFTLPPDDDSIRESVKEIEHRFYKAVENFNPVNRAILDMLFPNMEKIQPVIDLIVGFPEPYDAVTVKAPDGQIHLVFDLICWRVYAAMTDLNEIIRNMLTHEITHLLIGTYYPEVDAALESSDYLTKLDAHTFHEGFAHLISYQATEIDTVDWHSEKLEQVGLVCRSKMREALDEKDRKKQEQLLYDGICGSYYDKFACMCGMLYLSHQWELNGIEGLKAAFSDFHGFARKTLI